MSEYTPTFTKPYSDGWKNKPDETTPVTAEIMDAYDSAIESIESYLSENPIGESQGLILKDTMTEQKYMLTIANGNIEITAVE